jgi:hypothetical protein
MIALSGTAWFRVVRLVVQISRTLENWVIGAVRRRRACEEELFFRYSDCISPRTVGSSESDSKWLGFTVEALITRVGCQEGMHLRGVRDFWRLMEQRKQ